MVMVVVAPQARAVPQAGKDPVDSQRPPTTDAPWKKSQRTRLFYIADNKRNSGKGSNTLPTDKLEAKEQYTQPPPLDSLSESQPFTISQLRNDKWPNPSLPQKRNIR